MAANPPVTNFWNTINKTTQAFILALIIISAYVVFFAWVMVTAPKQNSVFNFDGMRDLTASFGIIAAAVVGYYFGQKNLEEATKTAQIANEVAQKSKNEAEVKKIEVKEEKKERVSSGKKAVPVYEDAKKFVRLASEKLLPKDIESISKEVNVDSLKESLDQRIKDVQKAVDTKEQEIKKMEGLEHKE